MAVDELGIGVGYLRIGAMLSSYFRFWGLTRRGEDETGSKAGSNDGGRVCCGRDSEGCDAGGKKPRAWRGASMVCSGMEVVLVLLRRSRWNWSRIGTVEAVFYAGS